MEYPAEVNVSSKRVNSTISCRILESSSPSNRCEAAKRTLRQGRGFRRSWPGTLFHRVCWNRPLVPGVTDAFMQDSDHHRQVRKGEVADMRYA
jgi:hypothetical protein